MIDPEGNTYEKSAILQWLNNNNTSPITRTNLLPYQLHVNRALKDAITEFLQRNNIIIDGDQQHITIQPVEITITQFDDSDKVSITTESYKNDSSLNETYLGINLNIVDGTEPVPVDIVVVMDISGSMCSAATVEQGGQQIDVGFSVLDITKHAIKTVIESMDSNDRISIVTYSNNAKVISTMTVTTSQNKEMLKNKVQSINTDGATNLWDGIKTGLNQFNNITDGTNRNAVLLVMTDGQPSSHLCPPRGITECLKRHLNTMDGIIPTIYTFGFGYSLDTQLLHDISSIGKGCYSFIPDSGFVGTTIVHSMANIFTTIGRNAKIHYFPKNGATIKKVMGYNSTDSSSIGTIHYGQNKTMILIMDIPKGVTDYLDYKLEYTGTSGNIIEKSGIASSDIIITNISEGVPEKNNFFDNLYRLNLVDMGYQLIKNDLVNINESKEIVKKFLTEHSNKAKHPITVDVEGQIQIAVSRNDYYSRWGMNYIYSITSANKQQRRNNFKDKSVAVYGGKLFDKLVDKIDDIFNAMPPPTPSRMVNNIDGDNSDNSDNGGRYSPTSFTMNTFNSIDNGCMHEDCEVLMGDGSIKKCSEIKKGDKVTTMDGEDATVICVVKSLTHNNKQEMVKLPSDLIITPYHPVFKGTWQFPIDIIGNTEIFETSAVYTFIINKNYIMIINNTPCITLGHNLTEGVLKHHYFGTEVVINDLKTAKGFEEGLITFEGGSLKRNDSGEIVGYDLTHVI